MQLSPAAEDYLEHLYMRDVEGDPIPQSFPDDRLVGELLRHAFIQHEKDHFIMTPQGQRQAELAVRRHRLAERLLHDVIDVHGKQVDEAACEFEHSLHRGIDEHVCTLLGHPTTCPHGRPIPPGRCCHERKQSSPSAIASLAELAAGDQGTIAYLSSQQPEIVQKLMALGVLPGAPIHLVQSFPSFVFSVGQTQVAVDTALARGIYVRRLPIK
jgi:DtxR family Mn-dependent transcriptional regulator